uniref:Uncharacterized protein n=1 Tax=Rhizophora mucronata TaxID=61149 RepID=A0A2P2NQJ2_RHIMU
MALCISVCFVCVVGLADRFVCLFVCLVRPHGSLDFVSVIENCNG